MKVIVTNYEHRHGSDIAIYAKPEDAEAARQAVAEEWWDQEIGDIPKPDDPKEMADEYFENMNELGEYWTEETCQVQGLSPSYEQLLAFAQQMAQMTTPYDPDQVTRFKQEYPQFADLESADLRDEIYGEYPSNNAMEEASAFWRMIETARLLTSIKTQED
jgi:hypothetical protein